MAARDVDVLVANAAVPGSGRLATYSVEEVDRALDVNLRAPIVLARALTPGMVGRGRGHVVFISSIAGKTATRGSSLYNATKYGLRGFSLALRSELRSDGVGVSAIFPGFVRGAGMFAETAIKLPFGVGYEDAGAGRGGRRASGREATGPRSTWRRCCCGRAGSSGAWRLRSSSG